MIYFLTFLVVLVSSCLSGLSGGGGGFIMTPFFLLMGLSPQQNMAVGSVIGLGLSGGALFAARRREVLAHRSVMPLVLLATLATVAATFVLPRVHTNVSHALVGWFVLLAIPTLFIKKSRRFTSGVSPQLLRLCGYALYALLWFANGVLSAGFAALLFVPMLFCLGLNAVEANVAKRYGALAQAVVLFVVLVPQGLVLWGYALPSVLGSWLGGHVGTHLAIKNGDHFARFALAGVMFVSGVVLLR